MAPTQIRAVLLAFFAGILIASPAVAQMSESDLVMRLNRMENQVRQLTGQVEQLQYRNQQLEQQLARGSQGAAPAPPQRQPVPQQQYSPPQQAYPPAQQTYPQQAYPQPQAYPPQQAYPQQQSVMEREPDPAPPPKGGRRGDAFDPNMNPNAPGVPRTLGRPGTVAAAPPLDNQASDEEPYVGAPGGREAGGPLDLGIMAEEATNMPPPRREVRTIPGALPAPPPRNSSGTGAQQMVMAPTNTPKDEYDLAYGYVLRKDYALAEEGLRAFLKKYPGDRLVADANYWLGESLFQRQRYREAAESFLTVSTKFDTAGKAPDSLLRLGQSLAALKEKEAACATLGELPRKYPRAAANVKQAAEKEQKRVGCI
jgi:tol-pal system protein YbgF